MYLFRSACGLVAIAMMLAVGGVSGAHAATDIRGWAFIGKDLPVQGATVSITDADGSPVRGLTATTGLHGEFVIAAGSETLPRRTIAIVRNGFVKGAPLKGRLRAQVSFGGPARGIVHVSPLSTLALAVRAKHPAWSKRQAERRAAVLIGAPVVRLPHGHPHADGAALLKHSNAHVHASSLHRHAMRLGGYVAWEQVILAAGRQGNTTKYQPSGSATSTRQGGAALSIAWSLVANAAASCDPDDSSVPGVGMLASAVANAGLVSQNPACDLAAIAAALDAIKAELDQIEATLNTQSQLLGSIQDDVRQDAYANSVSDFSSTTAAISTVQLHTQLLVDSIASYQAAKSASNPDGLGIGIDKIFALPDQTVATTLRNLAKDAQGPSTTGWDIAYSRFTQDGVIAPGSSSKGLIRLGWEAVRTASPFVDVGQLRDFTAINTYYRSLYALLGAQQVDQWRSEGVPQSVIVSNVAQRKPLDDAFAGWMPRIPTVLGMSANARATSPMIDPVSGLAWTVVCQAPSAKDPKQCPPEGAWGINAASPAPGNMYDPLSYWMRVPLPSLGADATTDSVFSWPTKDQLATLRQRATTAGISGAAAQAAWLDSSTAVLKGTGSRPVFALLADRIQPAIFQPMRTVFPGVYWGCDTSRQRLAITWIYAYYGCSNGALPLTIFGGTERNPTPTDGRIFATARMVVSGAEKVVGPSAVGGGNAPNRVRCTSGPAACRPDTWRYPWEVQVWNVASTPRELVPTAIPLVVSRLPNPRAFLPFPG